MDSKCMNPIIYIDELDKVSKTENGKEIIGILTHLVDTAQNDIFQDKYFSGVNIDLSKVLFIFSYNNPDLIDPILLDRIHRIKFDNLDTYDKLEIANQFIIPEINTKMGFYNTIQINSNTLEYIIEHYTQESGVRKLKEIIFDLFGEINLEILKCNSSIRIPITIEIDELETKYMKNHIKFENHTIHTKDKIGVINGLWANACGKGGVIPIEAMFFPSSTFLELKLTGLQGEVMKESMNVAKTLAWNLTPDNKKKELLVYFENTKCQGLHINCPYAGISKDGPSAGAAITIAIYSLFNNLKIKNNIAITGEINLQGNICQIGGLDVKIYGGIKAGVTTFLFPKLNKKEYINFIEKCKNKTILNNISVYDVDNIKDVLNFIF
jgi:ATP-dependent Lon protease